MQLLDLFFSAQGRICRKQFWIVHISLLVVHFALMLILFGLFGRSAQTAPFAPGAVLVLWGILATYISAVNQIKRLHDRRYSGWTLLIALVPIAGIVWLLVTCGFLKGTQGQNLYGPDPINGSNENLSPDSQKPADKKAIGILTICASVWFLIVFASKTYYALSAIFAALSGKLSGAPIYQVSRLMGSAVSSIVIYLALIVMLVWGIKAIRKAKQNS